MANAVATARHERGHLAGLVLALLFSVIYGIFRIGLGTHLIETPAGIVEVNLLDANTAQVKNVEARRVHKSASLDVPGLGTVTGDVAYGGNWFFIVEPSPIEVSADNRDALTNATLAIRQVANAQGVGGENGEPIDHVIFQQASENPEVFARNFVLCPDDTYDRSPCGTGSSAILACLAADGRLAPGAEIVQESVIGSPYRLFYQPGPNGGVLPTITGQAFVIADAVLHFDEADPYRLGIAS